MLSRTEFRLFFSSLVVSLSLAGCGAPGDELDKDAQPKVAQSTAAVVTTCPDPKSCGSWSIWYNEGGPTCQSAVPGCGVEICHPCHCTQDGCQECCNTRPGPANEQLQQSFRDCKLRNNQPCRETQEQTIVLACGC